MKCELRRDEELKKCGKRCKNNEWPYFKKMKMCREIAEKYIKP